MQRAQGTGDTGERAAAVAGVASCHQLSPPTSTLGANKQRSGPRAPLACKFGPLLLSRPVAVAVWFQQQKTRGTGLTPGGCARAKAFAEGKPPPAARTQSACTHLLTKFCGMERARGV